MNQYEIFKGTAIFKVFAISSYSLDNLHIICVTFERQTTNYKLRILIACMEFSLCLPWFCSAFRCNQKCTASLRYLKYAMSAQMSPGNSVQVRAKLYNQIKAIKHIFWEKASYSNLKQSTFWLWTTFYIYLMVTRYRYDYV